MVNPPKEGINSPETVKQYKKEYDIIYGGLKERSKLLTQKLNEIKGLKANELEGAMFAFPRISLTESAIKAAHEKGFEPDAFYCLEAMEETGLVLVPGSGFMQRPGTWHFRMSNLIFQKDELEEALVLLKRFSEKFFAKYP